VPLLDASGFLVRQVFGAENLDKFAAIETHLNHVAILADSAADVRPSFVVADLRHPGGLGLAQMVCGHSGETAGHRPDGTPSSLVNAVHLHDVALPKRVCRVILLSGAATDLGPVPIDNPRVRYVSRPEDRGRTKRTHESEGEAAR
jgi:hypothetical protein